ncbi:MAG: hypothetical protein ABFC57_00020 [Veillonellales bacterium]
MADYKKEDWRLNLPLYAVEKLYMFADPVQSQRAFSNYPTAFR